MTEELKLTKKGLIKGKKNVTQYIYSYMNERFKIEKGVTIRKLMEFSDDEIIDYLFHHQWFKDYKEYIKDKKMKQFYDYILIDYTDNDYDIIGVKENNRYAVDTENIVEYCDTEIRLGKRIIKNIKENMKDIMLFDLYNALMQEISYHGSPENTEKFHEKLKKAFAEVKDEENIK